MSGEKKTIESLNFENVRAILLDVAGTTTAIDFIKEKLFPYVAENVEEYLKSSWEDESVKNAIAKFEEKDIDVTKAAEIVKTLTEKNDSNVGLKVIQGLLFKKGYTDGKLKGHIYDDVLDALESWSKSRQLAIFSTGSIESQELLFKNSTKGDLSSHITKYFDQSVGSKIEAESYKKIAKELDVSTDNILFLTDDVKEAEAAKAANLIVVLIKREGNASIPEEHLSTFAVVESFAQIPLDGAKRKIEEETVDSGRKKAPPSKLAKTENNDQEASGDQEAKKQENKIEDSCSMDVDGAAPDKGENATETATKNDSTTTEIKEIKKDTEIGTQTKIASTMEIETQTAITIKVNDELPMETVEEKLKKTNPEKSETDSEEKQVKSDEQKPDKSDEEKPTKSDEKSIKSNEDKNVKSDEQKSIESEKPVISDEQKLPSTEIVEQKTVAEEKATKKAAVEKEVVTENKEAVEPETNEVKNEPTKADDEVIKNEATEEKKVTETKEVVDAAAKSSVNGETNKSTETVEETIVKENGVAKKDDADAITEEKENKSDLANGTENVMKGETSETPIIEEELKLKSVEGNVESAPVSVEA